MHQRNLIVLALEMYKITHEKSPNFMKDLVEEIDRNYHTRSSYEVELDENGNVKKCSKKSNYRLQNVNTVTIGHQSFRCLVRKIQALTPNEWKNINSIAAFKSKLKIFEFQNCPCTLCKEYLQGVGYIKLKLLHRLAIF